MSNLFKEKRNSLMKEFSENKPEFLIGKKIVCYLMFLLVTSRIIHAILVIIHSMINGNYLNPTSIISQLFQVLVLFIFSMLIYASGIKGVSYLLLLGGIISIAFAFMNNAFFGFGSEDILFNIIVIIFTLSIAIQICSVVFIIFNKKCKVYFVVMKDLMIELKKMTKAGI